jgi:hypothetical protein
MKYFIRQINWETWRSCKFEDITKMNFAETGGCECGENLTGIGWKPVASCCEDDSLVLYDVVNSTGSKPTFQWWDIWNVGPVLKDYTAPYSRIFTLAFVRNWNFTVIKKIWFPNVGWGGGMGKEGKGIFWPIQLLLAAHKGCCIVGLVW